MKGPIKEKHISLGILFSHAHMTSYFKEILMNFQNMTSSSIQINYHLYMDAYCTLALGSADTNEKKNEYLSYEVA